MVKRASISLVARNEAGSIVGVCFGITDYAYWLFITDLGVVRECAGQGIGTALVRKLHQLAGGEENIIMYTCFNENAYGFYEKLGMHKPDDVVVLNKIAWTDFTVECDYFGSVFCLDYFRNNMYNRLYETNIL